MGWLDSLGRLLGKEPRTPQQEAPSRAPDLTPIDHFISTAGYAKNNDRFNRMLPMVVDRLVADALYRILRAYFAIHEDKGEQAAVALFTPFCMEMNVEAERYRTIRTVDGARTIISMLAEKTDRFARTVERQIGADHGILLAAKQFTRALQRLQEAEKMAR